MNRPSHASNLSIEMEFMKNEDAESIDNYYRDYVDQQQKSSIPQLFLLILQNCLSSLRAPLYIRLGPNPLTRAAWRSGFIALLYIPSMLKQIIQNKSQFYGILNHQKQFIILSISQAIYVLSLSIAIQYTHVSYALMFFNSQLLIHCALKGKSMNRYEFIGFLTCVVLFIAIIRNHNFTFYQKDELSDLDHIVKGDLVALIGGAVFQQIYARYYTELLTHYNPGILSGISRILSSFLLYLVTQAFEDTTDFTQFAYDSSIFIEIFCNALFTGYLPNQIQIIVEKHFIPLTYNSFAAFQPTIGSVYSYLLGQESFPSFYTLLSTVLFGASLCIIQYGRFLSEVQDLKYFLIQIQFFFYHKSFDLELNRLDSVNIKDDSFKKATEFTRRASQKMVSRHIIKKQYVDLSIDH